MAKIHIGKADCIDNETFELLALDAGLDAFDENDDPKDVDTLTIVGELDNEGSFRVHRNDVDAHNFDEWCQAFGVSSRRQMLKIKITSASLS